MSRLPYRSKSRAPRPRLEWLEDRTNPGGGALDLTFDADGKVTTPVGQSDAEALSTAIQADGKIVAAGYDCIDVGGLFEFALTRYNTDGSLDTSFDGDGKVTTAIGSSYAVAYSVAIQADGKIIAGGYSADASGNDEFTLTRYNPDGSLDTSFDGDGILTTTIMGSTYNVVASVALQADGKIVAAGYSFNGTKTNFALARYNPDGSLDSSFDDDGTLTTSFGSEDDGAISVAIQPDGKIVAAGSSNSGGFGRFALARYNTDGSLDSGFDDDGMLATSFGTGSVDAQGVAIQADGKIVAAGHFFLDGTSDFALARYNADGSLDSSFDGDGMLTADFGSSDDSASGVAIQSDGKIVAVGSSDVGGNYDFALTRYNADGTLDSTFNGNGKEAISIGSADEGADAVAIQADGKIVAAGSSYNGSSYDFALVRVLGEDQAPPTPTVTVDPAQANATNVRSPIVFDVTFDQTVTGFDASQIAFTGSTATGMTATLDGSGSNYVVTVTGATSDGTVVISVLAGTGSEGVNTSGQNNLTSAGSATVTIDTVPPAVTINQGPSQNDPTNFPSMTFDVQFSEPITGFAASDVVLSGTAGGALNASVAPGIPANSFVVTVTGMTSSGTVIASIPAGAAQDPADNNSLDSTSTDNSVSFDNVPPSITITPNPAGTVGGTSVTFDVLFGEAVIGFDATKVDLSGTTAPGATVAVSGTGPDYTVTISGMTGGGTITAQIDAGVVTDLATNPNLASGPASVNYVHSGTVQFSAPVYSINEQGTPILTVTATRTGGSVGSLIVNYAAADGTAVLGTDYGAPTGTGTLTWGPTDILDKTFTIPILENGVLEADKAFTVVLSGISLPGALGTPSTSTVNILETAGLSFSAANYNVNATDGTVSITVKRLFDSSGIVSVHFATSDGTAVSTGAVPKYTTTSIDHIWADADQSDWTFTVPIAAVTLSEGNEKFNLTLSAATGNSELGPISTATVSIAHHDGVTITGSSKIIKSMFSEDGTPTGDQVTIKLAGKAGTLTYYLTDSKGPISEIDLAGTDSSKSVVSIRVKKPKRGTDDGRVQIGEIDGTGAKSLSLPKADLVGVGINLFSFLGSLTIGDIRNGADLTLVGAPPTKPKMLATKITAGVIGDGTDVAITGAPLGRLAATSIGIGTITAPSVGSISIKGKAKTKTTLAIPGDFKSNLTIAGTGLPPRTAALKSLKVAGSASGSTIIVGGLAGTVGDVGSVSVGSFVNSELLAGYARSDNGTGNFNLPSTVRSFKVTGKTNAFVESFVIASNFKNVFLASVDPTITGTKFGFLYHTAMKALQVKSTKFKFLLTGPAEQDMPSSDFEVAKV